MLSQKFINTFRDLRTNWKCILIVLIFATVVGGGILGFWLVTKREAPQPAVPPVGEEVIVRGEVKDLDAEPLSRDGDGILRLRTEDGKNITALFPARERLCGTVGVLEVFRRTKVGDEVEVFGKMAGKNKIILCDSADYYLKIIGTNQVTVKGKVLEAQVDPDNPIRGKRIFTIRTADGKTLQVKLPYRAEIPCAAWIFQEVAWRIIPNDTIEASGTKSNDGDIIICDSSDHYLKIVDRDTSDWKIFRNEEFGFEFKYPQRFNIVSSTDRVEIYRINAQRPIAVIYLYDMAVTKIDEWEEEARIVSHERVSQKSNVPITDEGVVDIGGKFFYLISYPSLDSVGEFTTFHPHSKRFWGITISPLVEKKLGWILDQDLKELLRELTFF